MPVVRKLKDGGVDGFLLYNKFPADIIWGKGRPVINTTAAKITTPRNI